MVVFKAVAVLVCVIGSFAVIHEDARPYGPHHHGPMRRGIFNSSVETKKASSTRGPKGNWIDVKRFSINGALGHMTQVYDPV